MVVGIGRVSLAIHESQSLKSKRQVLRSLLDRVRNRFNNVAIAEVGDLDLWQRATVGFAVVSNERAHANEMADKIADFIESLGVAEVLDRRVTLESYGEDLD